MAAASRHSTRFLIPALSTFLLILASHFLTGTCQSSVPRCGFSAQALCTYDVENPCCSSSGWCGQTPVYCGQGCQVQWSAPNACQSNTTTADPSVQRCGSEANGAKCTDNMCCSKFGFCGLDAAFCYDGCQSQCRLKPAVIVGIVIGALAGLAILCGFVYFLFRQHLNHERRRPYTRDTIQSVHRLFPNDEADDADTSLDIVFCHGFAIGDLEKDAWRRTWLANDDVCWPKDWIGNDLDGKARIFSLEYDGNVTSEVGHNSDVSEIGKNLLQRIFGHPHRIGQSNAVVLIGHSFGGLVIKSLVVQAHEQKDPRNDTYTKAHAEMCRKFIINIRGFVFYAVPHSGADTQSLENYMNLCGSLYRRWKRKNQPPELLANIRQFSQNMEALTIRFENIIRSPDGQKDGLTIYAFVEGSPMTREDPDVIVPQSSAVRLSGNNFYKVEAANHMTVCRPKTKVDDSYVQLLYVLQLIISNDATSKVEEGPLSPKRFHAKCKEIELEPLNGGSFLPS